VNGHDRVLSMIDGRPTDSLPFMPFTMMFAGDYLGKPYLEYATDFRVLVAGQLKVAEDFDVDLVSTTTDPAAEAADCGAQIAYFADQPPAIDESHALLADKTTLERLEFPDPLGGGRMHNLVKAVALYRDQVGGDKLIEAWTEGPIAEAADLRGINQLMLDFYDDPSFVRDLFEFVLELELRFARAEVAAGADLMAVGDAAASLVGPQIYREFVWPYEKRLIDGLHGMGVPVRLHICGNIKAILPEIGALECQIVDIDSMVSMADARAAVGSAPALIANLDPVRQVRNGTPESIKTQLDNCRREAGEHFIVGAGCEIVRDTPVANLRAMLAYARAAGPTAASI
jgi:MtaA/CmuA family methyltransferase